jgi:hypothetical protein
VQRLTLAGWLGLAGSSSHAVALRGKNDPLRTHERTSAREGLRKRAVLCRTIAIVRIVRHGEATRRCGGKLCEAQPPCVRSQTQAQRHRLRLSRRNKSEQQGHPCDIPAGTLNDSLMPLSILSSRRLSPIIRRSENSGGGQRRGAPSPLAARGRSSAAAGAAELIFVHIHTRAAEPTHPPWHPS